MAHLIGKLINKLFGNKMHPLIKTYWEEAGWTFTPTHFPYSINWWAIYQDGPNYELLASTYENENVPSKYWLPYEINKSNIALSEEEMLRWIKMKAFW